MSFSQYEPFTDISVSVSVFMFADMKTFILQTNQCRDWLLVMVLLRRLPAKCTLTLLLTVVSALPRKHVEHAVMLQQSGTDSQW